MGRVRSRLIHNHTPVECAVKYAEIKLRRANRAGFDAPELYLFDKLKDIGGALQQAAILAHLNADDIPHHRVPQRATFGMLAARRLGTHWNLPANDYLAPYRWSSLPIAEVAARPRIPRPSPPFHARPTITVRPSPASPPCPPTGLREGIPQPLSEEAMAVRRAIPYLCDPPDYFCCPVACDLLEQPAALPSGHLFELTSLLAMVEDGRLTCPLSKRTYSPADISFVYPMRDAIDAWKAANQAA